MISLSSSTLYVPSVSELTAASTDAVSLSSIFHHRFYGDAVHRTFFMSLFSLYYTIRLAVLQIIKQFFR